MTSHAADMRSNNRLFCRISLNPKWKRSTGPPRRYPGKHMPTSRSLGLTPRRLGTREAYAISHPGWPVRSGPPSCNGKGHAVMHLDAEYKDVMAREANSIAHFG